MLSRYLGRSYARYSRSKFKTISSSRQFDALACRSFSNGNLKDQTKSLFKQQPSSRPASSVPFSSATSVSQTNVRPTEGMQMVDAIANLITTSEVDNAKNEDKLINDQRMERMDKIHSILEAGIDKLTGSEALKILVLLNKMKIRITFIDYPDLLRHLDQQIDELSFEEICDLSFTLHQMPVHTPFKQIIQKKIQHKFKTQILGEFPDNDINFLAKAIRMVSQNFDEVEYRQLLHRIMMKLWKYSSDIPADKALSIFKSLAILKNYPSEWICLLQKIQNEIKKHVHDLEGDQITFLFKLAVLKEKHDNPRVNHFYDEQLFDQLINKAINQNVDFRKSLQILGYANRMRHKNQDLLNFSCAAYLEKLCLQSIPIDERMGYLITLVTGMALARYKPVFWDEIQNSILNNHELLGCTQETLIILATNLMALGCYPTRMLRMIFSQVHDFSNQHYLGWTFTKIYQKLKSDQNYDGPMPSDSQVENLNILAQKAYRGRVGKKLQLLEYLQRGVENPQFIKSNVITHLSHVIDHVIAFKIGGENVAISKSTSPNNLFDQTEYLEDLVVPPDCILVPIIYAPIVWCFRNTEELTGLHQMAIDALESITPNIVIVKDSTWRNIPVSKRTHFLMKEIHSSLMPVFRASGKMS
ncbi:hypothetical protein QAD02_012350 [Eretmocerus hayati]|uniref:Uncharacterized protein n=1 Tax=Eretmocerus hayati TaxID=131215 RepID=A0ACC2P0C0_9HYME|nr:hypothetical protein QAD02_012350 [Eretmocerus hayati]